MIKTPVKVSKPEKVYLSKDKGSTKSNTKTKTAGKDQQISRAIETFICSTLKPLLSSKADRT